jgi:DnaJ-class molecular chaperone
MSKKYRILIEETCQDCEGEGALLVSSPNPELPPEGAECSGCDGTGFQEITVSLGGLKDLLEAA